MQPTLVTLEGDRTENDLLLFPQTEEDEKEGIYLFGDNVSGKRFKVSLAGDSIEQLEYSPLYRNYVSSNQGTQEAQETFLADDGLYWHADKNGFLLGCSVCIVDESLNGDESPQIFYHFNLDGSLAGYSLPDQNQNFVTLSGVDELGFFKGLKMPSFKMPKLPKIPKIKAPKMPKIKMPKLPKFKMPKIKIPKIKMPKIKVPDIGKAVSKVGSQIGKGVSNIGNQIGKGIQKHVENIAQVAETIAEGPGRLLDVATGILAPGGGEGEAGEEEQASDITQPGYQDEQGYTGEDGLYYLNDGSGYMNPQTEEWFNMDGTPMGQSEQASDITQPGYTDEQGYTADDGMYYLNDGSGYMDPQTQGWFNMDGSPYGSQAVIEEAQVLYGDESEDSFMKELGFDLSSLSSLASSPLVSAGLNAFIPGAGVGLSMLSQGINKKKKPTNKVNVLSTLNKLTMAKKTSSPIVIKKAPPKKPPVSNQPVARAGSMTPQMLQNLRTLQTPQQAPAKEDNKKLLLYVAGGGMGLYLIFKMMNQGRGRK